MRKKVIFMYLLLACISSMACNNNKKENSQDRLFEKTNLISAPKTNLNISDTTQLNVFVNLFFENVSKGNTEYLSQMFDFPIYMFNQSIKNSEQFIKLWKSNQELRSYLSLDIYDDNDVLIGFCNLNTCTNVFVENGNNLELSYWQIGIGNGIILNIRQAKGELLIVSIDVVG